jgi:hypothetical protein
MSNVQKSIEKEESAVKFDRVRDRWLLTAAAAALGPVVFMID